MTPLYFWSMSSYRSSSANNFYTFICLGREPSFLLILLGGRLYYLMDIDFLELDACNLLLVLRLVILRGARGDQGTGDFLLLKFSYSFIKRVIFQKPGAARVTYVFYTLAVSFDISFPLKCPRLLTFWAFQSAWFMILLI